MRMTRRLAIVIAVVCGALAALLTYIYLSSLQQPTQPIDTAKKVQVITPIHDIKAGTLLRSNMLTTQEVLDDEAPANAARSLSQVSGKLNTVDLSSGEPVLLAHLQSLGTGGLAYAVPEGMRAVTVALDPIVGVAGFLNPGDRVDVIATFEVKEFTVTRTVLQNIKLLALGTTAVVGPKKAKGTEKEGEEGAPEAQPEAQPNATLAVTPEQAQKLVLADARGRLRLALRPKWEEQYIPLPATRSADVIGEDFEKLMASEQASEPPPPATLAKQPHRPTVEVIRGSNRETVVIGGRPSSSIQGGDR